MNFVTCFGGIWILFSETPLQETDLPRKQPSHFISGKHEDPSGDQRWVSLSELEKNDVCPDGSTDKTLSKFHENAIRTIPIETPVVVSRKDAVYQGSLHNIPLFNVDTDEYHNRMIRISDMTNETANGTIEEAQEKSFFGKIAEQIDLRLLKDAAFALFAVSNFLTSLGFNVPYNFANDLAADANVVYYQRHWIIMSIGVSNCFGRVIIGFLADRSWVKWIEEIFCIEFLLFYQD